jgi:hypothetical protein
LDTQKIGTCSKLIILIPPERDYSTDIPLNDI